MSDGLCRLKVFMFPLCPLCTTHPPLGRPCSAPCFTIFFSTKRIFVLWDGGSPSRWGVPLQKFPPLRPPTVFFFFSFPAFVSPFPPRNSTLRIPSCPFFATPGHGRPDSLWGIFAVFCNVSTRPPYPRCRGGPVGFFDMIHCSKGM